MKKILTLVIIIIFPLFTSAQWKSYKRRKRKAGHRTAHMTRQWKNKRYHLTGGLGITHFLGDLGGGSGDARHFLGVSDIDWKYTRPTLQIGFKYRVSRELAVKPTFTYGYLKADDLESGSLGRRGRNLHFASNLWELGFQLEYAIVHEKEMARYTFSSLQGWKRTGIYLILGGGAFYFNPRARDEDGNWVNLRPLNTEGQGTELYEYKYKDSETSDSIVETIIPDAPYKKFAFSLGVGIGFIYSINRSYSIGLEITTRYTSTDYIDDAHDRYYAGYDINSENQREQQAAYFADRHLMYSWDIGDYVNYRLLDEKAPNYPTGKPGRGNPAYNDAYIFTMITGYYKMRRVFGGKKHRGYGRKGRRGRSKY